MPYLRYASPSSWIPMSKHNKNIVGNHFIFKELLLIINFILNIFTTAYNQIFTFLINSPKLCVLDRISAGPASVFVHHYVIITSYQTISTTILAKGNHMRSDDSRCTGKICGAFEKGCKWKSNLFEWVGQKLLLLGFMKI